MPKIKYEEPSREIAKGKGAVNQAIRAKIIEQAQTIVAQYINRNVALTVRQLYYRFVAGDLFPAAWADPVTGSTNNERSYQKLCDIVAYGRMTGQLDWDAIVDETRRIREPSYWDSPESIVKIAADTFCYNTWEAQPYYLEVWIEKDAALSTIRAVCDEYRVPFMSCRGYASVSEIWRAGHKRFRPRIQAGKKCRVLYLGDHDPSGINMPEDLQARLDTFTRDPGGVVIERLALTMDQVELYDPPPSPAKITDSRSKAYIERFNTEDSWELDALEPSVVHTLIEDAIKQYRDEALWDEWMVKEERARERLAAISDNWEAVEEFLEGLGS